MPGDADTKTPLDPYGGEALAKLTARWEPPQHGRSAGRADIGDKDGRCRWRTTVRHSLVRHIPASPRTVVILVDVTDCHLVAKERQAMMERSGLAQWARNY